MRLHHQTTGNKTEVTVLWLCGREVGGEGEGKREGEGEGKERE